MNNLLVEDSEFTNATEGLVVGLGYGDHCENISAVGCSFTDMHIGIELKAVDYIMIDDCSFAGTMPFAIQMDNGRFGTVKNCDISTSQENEEGRFIYNGLSQVEFLDNTFKSVDGKSILAGIDSTKSCDNVFQSNIFYLDNTETSAIDVSFGCYVCASNQVIGNAPLTVHGSIDPDC